MKTILSTILSAAFAGAAFAQVPSLINYQGRLTDANGAAVTGIKNFSISIFDAATGGNLLYTEDIGAVTLDDNGVYSFQFGAGGISNKQATETIGTTADSTLTYTKTLSNTPIVENSITVTDRTNSWSQSVGNPGVGATATLNIVSGFVVGATITDGGSGYTSVPAVTITGNGTGATATATLTGGVVSEITINSAGSGYTGSPTISIDPPVIPFRVDYSGGAITATYTTAPPAGRNITASYRYTDGSISGALASGSEHWMAVSVDTVTQGTRQRVLAVPFAQQAASANEITIKHGENLNLILFSTGSYSNPLPISGPLGPETPLYIQRLIGKEISKINGIKAYISGGGVSSNHCGTATSEVVISIVEYSKNGVQTLLDHGSIIGGSGIISLDKHLLLDHKNNEYAFTVTMRNLGGQYCTPLVLSSLDKFIMNCDYH